MVNGSKDNRILILKKSAGSLYLILLIYLLFFAHFRAGTLVEIQLIPFNTAAEFIENFRPSSILHWLVNFPGNILMFTPLPLIFKWYGINFSSPIYALITAMLLSIVIETVQYMAEVGVANIDDVLLNTIGFMLGYFWLRKKTRLSPPKSE